MLTAFGKALRKYRIDNELLLKDMADAINVSVAFLSAVEIGKKRIPADLISKLKSVYTLNEETVKELVEAAAISNNEVRFVNLNRMELPDREGVLAFAKNFENLGPDEKNKIISILKGESVD